MRSWDNKAPHFTNNANVKYTVKASENNNKSIDVVPRVRIKKGHMRPLQASRNHDAKVLLLSGVEWEVVVDFILSLRSRAELPFGLGNAFLLLWKESFLPGGDTWFFIRRVGLFFPWEDEGEMSKNLNFARPRNQLGHRYPPVVGNIERVDRHLRPTKPQNCPSRTYLESRSNLAWEGRWFGNGSPLEEQRHRRPIALS